MANSHMYSEIKNALHSQITTWLDEHDELIDVYPVPYQNIAIFPAVTLELDRRRKPKIGVGVRELQLDMNIWVYTDILDTEDAEEECLRVCELIEDAIESDKTLGGKVTYLSLDDEAEFGTVQNGEASFLQGARLSLQIKKRFAK